MQPHHLSGAHVLAERDRAAFGVGADHAADEEVTLLVLGLAGVDHDAEQEARSDQLTLRPAEGLEDLTELDERGLAGELVDDAALGARHGQLGPERRRALRDARLERHAVEDEADRALLEHELAVEQRRAVVGGASAHVAADHGHRRTLLAQRDQQRVGVERVRVGKRDHARRLAEVGHTREHHGVRLDIVPLRRDRPGVEGVYGALVERSRPYGDRRAGLDLRARRQHAARPATDQRPGTQRLVHALEERLRRGQVISAGKHDGDVGALAGEPAGGLLRGIDGCRARIAALRQRRADADRHDAHDTEPMSAGVIALFGPTGVGKTDVAVALAHALRERGEHPVAVSADALQVYCGLEILTGVASAAQQRELEHRLVSFVPVDARFSVAEYAELAHAEIDAVLAGGATPIVVGGTGLYLRAALTELSLRPPPPPGVRERWQAELERGGPHALHATLAARAPWAAATIDPADRRRIVRALELEEIGALEPPEGDSELWSADVRHPTRLIGLVMERDALYARIDRRVDAMVAAGVIDEVRAAHRAGASSTARAALGFAELLAGDVDAMKRRTRNYAKRQLTWMRKLAGVELIDAGERSPDELAAALQ